MYIYMFFVPSSPSFRVEDSYLVTLITSRLLPVLQFKAYIRYDHAPDESIVVKMHLTHGVNFLVRECQHLTVVWFHNIGVVCDLSMMVGWYHAFLYVWLLSVPHITEIQTTKRLSQNPESNSCWALYTTIYYCNKNTNYIDQSSKFIHSSMVSYESKSIYHKTIIHVHV